MACLPDPRTAANRVKRVLHAVFENTFNFDLEDLRKKNLGPTVKWLEKLDGMTGFAVAYTVQAALGGHAIPIDTGTMAALRVLDLVTEKDAAAGEVPGIERAVAKAKGMEFGSLLHELGADYSANPYSAAIRDILVQIEPECQSRLPKRRPKPAAAKPQEPAAAADEKPVKRGKESKDQSAATAGEAESHAAEAPEEARGRKRPPTGTAPERGREAAKRSRPRPSSRRPSRPASGPPPRNARRRSTASRNANRGEAIEYNRR